MGYGLIDPDDNLVRDSQKSIIKRSRINKFNRSFKMKPNEISEIANTSIEKLNSSNFDAYQGISKDHSDIIKNFMLRSSLSKRRKPSKHIVF